MGTGAEMSGTKKTSVAGRLEAVVAVVGKLNVAVVTGAIQHGVVLFPPVYRSARLPAAVVEAQVVATHRHKLITPRPAFHSKVDRFGEQTASDSEARKDRTLMHRFA